MYVSLGKGALEDFDKPIPKAKEEETVAAPEPNPAEAEWNEEFLT